MTEEVRSAALVYVCCKCGRAMRTRGIDGRCYDCIEPPPERCTACQRVRLEPGGDWENHPGKLPGEIPTLCSSCWAARHKAAQATYWRGVRQVQRNMAKGYGPAPEGVDPFEGFREHQAMETEPRPDQGGGEE